MDKVNIGESTLKDFGDVINEAADILNKGKVAFDNTIPDKTLKVLPYTGQAGALIPSKIGDLDDLTTTAKDNLVNAINEVNDSLKDIGDIDTTDLAKLNEYNNFRMSADFDDNISVGGAISLCHNYFIIDGHTPQTLNIKNNGNPGDIFLSNDRGDISIRTTNIEPSNIIISSSNDLEFNVGESLNMSPHTISEFKRLLDINNVDTSNFVNLNGAQTISGDKNFTGTIKASQIQPSEGSLGTGTISMEASNLDISSQTTAIKTRYGSGLLISNHNTTLTAASTGTLVIGTGDIADGTANKNIVVSSEGLSGSVSIDSGSVSIDSGSVSIDSGSVSINLGDVGSFNINSGLSGNINLNAKNFTINLGVAGRLQMDARAISEFKRILGIQ